MKGGDPLLKQEVEAIIEQGRQIQPAPDVVRARLHARARAAVAAASASSTETPALPSAWRGRRIAIAAGGLLLLGTGGAAAALYSRVMRAPKVAPTIRR